MLIVISPAKTLDYTSPLVTQKFTYPQLIDESERLIARCKQLTPAQIASLMKVSDKIASLNAVRFEQWSREFTPQNARPAVLAFKGDVYTGLAAESLTEADFDWAQTHLRILSGLYGVLRPLDLLQPYRLEMGTKLENERGANLYQFWGNIITEQLQQSLVPLSDNVLINLASNEYFSAVNLKQLQAKIITPVFKDEKNGKYKIISFYAKKARGMMVRYIIDNRIDTPEKIKQFDSAGYQYCAAESSATEWVFKRAEKDS